MRLHLKKQIYMVGGYTDKKFFKRKIAMTEYVVYITLGILAVLVLKPIVGLIVLWIKLKLEELQHGIW